MKKILIIKIIVVALFHLIGQPAFAQKKTITPEEYGQWKKLTSYDVSDDGKYTWYTWEYIRGVADSNSDYGIELQSVDGSFKQKIKAVNPRFAGNIFLANQGADSLFVFNLNTRKYFFLSNVSSYKTFENNAEVYLAYATDKNLIIAGSKEQKKIILPMASSFEVSPNGKSMAVVTKEEELMIVDLPGGHIRSITKSSNISKVVYNRQSNGLAYFCSDQQGHLGLYHYDFVSKIVKTLIDQSTLSANEELTDLPFEFSSDGMHVFFRKRSKRPPLIKDKDLKTTDLKIWTYRDGRLKGEERFGTKMDYLSVVPVKGGQSFQIENDSVEVSGSPSLNSQYVLVKSVVNPNISHWMTSQIPKYRLVDINSGEKISFIPKSHAVYKADRAPAMVDLSPTGKYVTWFDNVTGDFFCYEVATTKLCNITAGLGFKRDDKDRLVFIAGWLANDVACYGYSGNVSTIWQFDPGNKKTILNLTGNYLSREKITIKSFGEIQNGEVMLNVLDSNNNNGFATLQVGKEAGLKIKKLSPCLYSDVLEVKKAKSAKTFVLTRQDEKSSPNLVITSDFNDFTKLSDIHPESNYNWMTSELVRWKMPDGRIGKGILYKPENFDPNRKYPVIFHYYEIKNVELHQFRPIGSDIDIGNVLPISEYVSNGYVVFLPDIERIVPGDLARATINSVVSAAKYLTGTYPWVDGKRLGLQGHSMGGFETNILIANSNLFAAASESAGHCDMIVYRGQTSFEDIGSDFHLQLGWGQFGKDVFPWNALPTYIENSPILKADAVNTPLLMKHALDDGAVPFEQAQEWFTALRRLNKPVWLLEYLSGGHIIGGSNAFDYSLRQRQFFDHYLMGKPAPKWMTQGIPEFQKDYKSGLQYDETGAKP